MRQPSPHTLVIAAAAVLLCGPTWAEDAHSWPYLLETWTTDEGLPQNTVNAILQTRDGYLWAGTYDGLARFDGLHFTTFNTANTPELGSNGIRALCEDRSGALWIGTNGGGLSRYAGGRFTTYKSKDGLASEMVWALAAAEDGGVWVGTNGAGVIHAQDGNFRRVGEPSDIVYSLAVDGKGGVYVGTGTGLKHLGGDGRWTVASTDGLGSGTVNAVAPGGDGELWASIIGWGVGRLRDGRLVSAWPEAAPAAGQGNSVIVDPRGARWLATTRGEIVRVEGARAELVTADRPLPANPVYSMHQDREGSLWIGTNGAGLLRLRKSAFLAYTVSEGLPHDFVYPVHQTPDGAVWVGTGGGLARFAAGRWTAFTVRDGLCHDVVRSLADDGEGGLWVATYGGGICRFSGGSWHRYTRSEGLADDNVRAVLRDSHGRLWAATLHGLSRLDGERFTSLTEKDGLPHLSLICLLEGRDGSLWIGTDGGGLARMREGRMETLTTADGLPSNVILTLRESGDGALLIGSNGGLARLKDGRIQVFRVSDGLPSDSITQILEDGEDLWVGSSHGVSRVSKKDLDAVASGALARLHVATFDKGDGMRSSQCTAPAQPAGLRDRDGRLWFGTSRGVAVLDPRRLERDAQRPPVVIESLVADDRSYSTHADAVVLPPGTTRVRIAYTGLCLLTPGRVRFRVSLDGFDQGWNDVGDRRVADYTNLRPGHYRFRVLAANGDGVWNEEGAALPVQLEPRYYQTSWFYVLLIGGLALGLAGADRLRVRRIRARERELTSLVAESTLSLLEEKERALDATEEARRQEHLAAEANALKGEFLSLAAHDLKSPLQVIMGYAEVMGRSRPEPEQLAATGRAVHRSARRMLALIEDLLAVSALDAGIEMRSEHVDLGNIALEVVGDLSAQAEKKSIRTELERDAACIVQGDPDRLRQALDNLVENALKFSPPGSRVRVRVERRDGMVRTEVQDEGQGFDADEAPRLFGRFQRLSARPTAGEHSTGLGLAIVKRLIELQGGRVFAESPGRGRGSRFGFELPSAAA